MLNNVFNPHPIYSQKVMLSLKSIGLSVSSTENTKPDQFFLLHPSIHALQQNYRYMKQCVESGPIPTMEQQRFDAILNMIPAHLQESRHLQDVIQDLFEEVKGDFTTSMKKSMSKSPFWLHYMLKSQFSAIRKTETFHRIWEENGKTQNFTKNMIFFFFFFFF